MNSDLRRSFKQKAKQAFELPSRLRKGLTDHLDGTGDADVRPMSFDFGCLLQEEQTGIIPSHGANQSGESEQGARVRQRIPVQPSGTFKYQVTSTDTVRSLAAKHGTTSSELKRLNRLHTETIFEGQIIYIPDGSEVTDDRQQQQHREKDKDRKSAHIPETPPSPPPPLLPPLLPPLPPPPPSHPPLPIVLEAGTDFVPGSEMEQVEVELLSYKPLQKLLYGGQDLLFTGIRPILTVTRHMTPEGLQRIGACLEAATREEAAEPESAGDIQFIKVPARHVKDKDQLSTSSVSGLLLLSADFVMFDPDPSDAKVLEGSLEEFSTILPIGSLASITLVKNAESLAADKSQIIVKETGEQLSKQVHVDAPFEATRAESKDEAEPEEAERIKKKTEPEVATESKVDDAHAPPKRRTASSSSGGSGGGVGGRSPQDADVSASRSVEKRRSTSMKKSSDRPLSIVGNFFRFGGVESPSSSSEVNSPIAADRVSGSGSGALASASVENVSSASGGSPAGSKIVSRTLSSLSSYSSSLIDDFSSHLFPAASSSPKLQPVTASPSSPTAPSPGYQHAEQQQHQHHQQHHHQQQYQQQQQQQEDRAFFLKPIDALTKKVKEQLSSSIESAGDDEDKDGDLYLMFKILADGCQSSSSSSSSSSAAAAAASAAAAAANVDSKGDYIFAVRHDKTATLFTFFLYWTPNSQDAHVTRDEPWFVLADQTPSHQQQPEVVHRGLYPGNVEEIERKRRSKEWKIVNLQELKRLVRISEIEKLPLPELSEESHILDLEMVKQLIFHLPPRAEGCKWSLVYSTEIHGFSLKTLFRRAEAVDGPTMVIVKDDKNQAFGAMLSCTLKPCDLFYGNGESYLFTFRDKFKKFGWSGENNYFIYATFDNISIGSGEGAVGLWLDGDLFYGRSQRCPTYRNEPLTEAEDFVVVCLELWRFV